MPLNITANSIKTNEKAITTIDQAVSSWHLKQHAICLREGTSIRDKSKLEKKEERNSEGFKYYNECMEAPTKTSIMIGQLVHDIRLLDKESAYYLLDIARGNKSNKDIKYPTIDLVTKIAELREIVKKEGI